MVNGKMLTLCTGMYFKNSIKSVLWESGTSRLGEKICVPEKWKEETGQKVFLTDVNTWGTPWIEALQAEG